MVAFFLRHYIFCITGAVTRYIMDYIFKRHSKKVRFSNYRDYKEDPAKEFLDAILGSFVLGILVSLLILFLE